MNIKRISIGKFVVVLVSVVLVYVVVNVVKCRTRCHTNACIHAERNNNHHKSALKLHHGYK